MCGTKRLEKEGLGKGLEQFEGNKNDPETFKG